MSKKEIGFSSQFKKQFAMRQIDPNWNDVFKEQLPEEIDSQRRTAWKYIVNQLIEGKSIPSYFKPHPIHAKRKLIKQIKKGLGNP
ncbi:hypothetical protein [Lactobacillus sp. ESL0681]|uniref:hypothetical protein n=1 Tax=Lactobacillus sp. ESL0681 TaxID=2983211 RepID=UPI0023F8EA30|nr:hypothetical protein [Lactobacillus sp. ESL0681]WEV39604.1 hypothetical protein OZX59_05145 [Lactobacillus sp. ESL0681]